MRRILLACAIALSLISPAGAQYNGSGGGLGMAPGVTSLGGGSVHTPVFCDGTLWTAH
jgi:hypothetical protein